MGLRGSADAEGDAVNGEQSDSSVLVGKTRLTRRTSVRHTKHVLIVTRLHVHKICFEGTRLCDQCYMHDQLQSTLRAPQVTPSKKVTCKRTVQALRQAV